jgi:hypothetical protein
MEKIVRPIALLLIIQLMTGFMIKFHPDEVTYPEGYRGWNHIKSGMLGPNHPNVHYRGFNHVYANDLAMKGFETGAFPEGTILIVDVIEASATNENYASEVKRHHMDVMQKDRVKFKATGGWGYAQFESDNRPRMLTIDQKKACFNCHLKQKDHVFSELRK